MQIRINMDDAIYCWLAAREAWIHQRQQPVLDRMNFATDVLYVAFVENAADTEKVTDAFYMFHKLLAEEYDKGLPQRTRLHPTPLIVGYA